MATDTKFETTVLLSQRKEKLLADGALYRAALVASRKTVTVDLGGESLARFAVEQLLNTAFSGLGTLFVSKKLDVQKLMPVVVGILSLLPVRALLRPLLKGAAVAAIGVLAVRFAAAKSAMLRR